MRDRLDAPLPDSLTEIQAEIDFWHEQKEGGALLSDSVLDGQVQARLKRLQLKAKQLEKSEKPPDLKLLAYKRVQQLSPKHAPWVWVLGAVLVLLIGWIWSL